MMMDNDLDEDVLFVDHGGPRRNKKKKNVSTKWCHSFTKTICLSLAFLALGLCIAIPGPTLLDLMDRVKTDTTHMLLIFSARSIGYLFGSLVGGFLFDHFDKQLLLASTLFLASIATTIIPWSLTLEVLAVMFSLQGIAMGVLDTGGNAFCVRIWGKKSPPYMQTMHFAYGIGAFLAPLLAHPFLSEHVPGLVLNSSHSLPAGNIPVVFKLPFDHNNDHNLVNNSISNSNRLMRSLSELERHVREQEDNDTSSMGAMKNLSNNPLNNELTSSVSTTLFTNATSVTIATTTTAKKSKKPHHTSSDSSDLDGSIIRSHLNKNKVKNNEDGQQTENTNAKATTKIPASETISETKLDISLVNKTSQLETDTEGTTNQSRKDAGMSESNSSSVVTIATTTSSGEPSVIPTAVVSPNSTVKIMASPNTVPMTTTSAPPSTSATTTTSSTTSTPTATTTTATTTITTSTLAPTTSTLAPTTSTEAPTTSTLAPTTSTEAPTTSTESPTTSTSTSTSTTSMLKTTLIPSTAKQATTAKPASLTKQPKTSVKKPETTSKPVVKTTVTIETTSNNASNGETTSKEITTESHKPETAGNLLTDAIDAVKNMSKIQFAYLIIGLLLLVNAAIFLTLYCCDKNRNDFTAMEIDKERYYKSSEHMCLRVIILFLMFLFFMSYVGMETTFGGLVMTFTVQYMNGTKHMGAIVTAIFWGSLAAGRGFSIFIARFCRPPSMLVIDLLLVIIGAALLSFAVSFFEFIIWVGTLALGLGMSSIFPTAVSWMEQYFTLTGKSTAVLVTGSAIGQMTVPVITGYLFDHYTNMALMYMVFALSLLISFLFLIMQLIASRTTRTVTVAATSSGFMPLQDEDDMEMDQVNYGTTNKGSARRRFMPTNLDDKYGRLPQDPEDDDNEEETDLLI